MSLSYSSSVATHVGHVRSHNEDAFLDKSEQGLWVIADGMGGHDAGDFASQLIVQRIDTIDHDSSVETYTKEIKEAVYSVNLSLIELGEKYDRVNGSTVVALKINNDSCDYIWAGDSRLYRLRNNELVQLTKDHSQAEIYVELGMLTRDEASQHASSNLLTRCVGIDGDLKLDTGSCELEHGDRFLLSSDGLDKHVSHEDIENTLIDYDRDDAMNQLINMALDGGGTDNVTVTIVDILAQ